MSNELPSTSPSSTYVEQVRQALAHLYDLAYLQNHPLPFPQLAIELSGQRLRWELAGAVEALSTGADVPFLSPQARPYNLLRLHYIQGVTIQEAAETLAISLRQAYRDLRRGEENLAAALWARSPNASGSPTQARWLSSPEMEIARLETRHQSVDLGPLLQSAAKSVKPLALQRHINLAIETLPTQVKVSANPVMAQQVLTTILSAAVRSAQPGELRVRLSADSKQPTCRLDYHPEPALAHLPLTSSVTPRLIERLGWEVVQEEQGGARSIILRMETHSATVLVVDDNEGLVELLDRYLSDHDCQVTAASNGNEGLRLAQQLLPNAIILDVMMPEMDGWEMLQRLRAMPHTTAIPVIVCSVINEPDLAYSLKASAFLSKPVARYDVLAALRELGIV